MINEVVEVKEYLEGKNINKKNIYRMCYLLSKWYKENGMTHEEIRNSIFKWANSYGIYITHNLNNIIYLALEDKLRLKDNIQIKINNGDIEEIKRRFDTKNTRLVALSLLCYAKAHADRDKLFSISLKALSCWIGITAQNLSTRYIKELYDFGYLDINRTTFKYDYKTVKQNIYKLKVDIHNNGNYLLVDNNIMDLYSKIF